MLSSTLARPPAAEGPSSPSPLHGCVKGSSSSGSATGPGPDVLSAVGTRSGRAAVTSGDATDSETCGGLNVTVRFFAMKVVRSVLDQW